MHADHPLSEAEWLTRKEETQYSNPNFSTICSKIEWYPASSRLPLTTSVCAGLKPSTSSASSSFPMQTSTYFINPVMTCCAFSDVHSFLRKFRSTEIFTPCFLAAISAFSVSTAAESEIAGVIPVKWNQSASAKMASKSNSCSVAVEIEE